RCDRIHPQAADCHARPRQGRAAGLGGTRRDPLAVGPHPRHVRRAHRRRARPGSERRRTRPAHGRGGKAGGGRVSAPYAKLPAWADYGLIPVLNLVAAFLVGGLVVLMAGENPIEALMLMFKGAFGSGNGIGYTLYYATTFIFTGLAVAVAFHCGLFNIGREGQAYIAGLGVAVV